MGDEETVLVLGYQTAILNAFDRAGARCVVAVPAHRWVHAMEGPFRDRFEFLYIVNSTDPEQVLSELVMKKKVSRVSSVFTQDEFALLSAALLAMHLGVRGPSCSTVLRFRDKCLQKEVLSRSGISVPAWRRLPADQSSLRSDAREFGFPSVIKPVAGAAAKHTYYLTSDEEAIDCLNSLADGGVLVSSRFMIERAIYGAEYHIDGVLVDREPVFLSIGRDLDNVLDFRHGATVGSTLLPRKFEPAVHDRLSNFALRVLRHLGLARGAFHMEVFVTETDVVFGECAARTAGGFISDANDELYRVELNDLAVQEHLELLPREYVQVPEATGSVSWATVTLPSWSADSEGVDLRRLLATPGVIRAKLLPPPTSSDETTSGDGDAMVLASGANPNEAEHEMRELLARLQDHHDPC